MVVEGLTGDLRLAGRATADDLAVLPGRPGVFLLADDAERPVLLAAAQHLRRAVAARLGARLQAARGRGDVAAVVRRVRWGPAECAFEARWRYYLAARALYPNDYRRHISIGPAWFLNVDWAARVPELRVTELVWAQAGAFVGPWPTHKHAQEALEVLWDLFDLCRYPQEVRRAPAGRRCAYADMGRCDAPCDGSAPLEDYAARCRSAWEFACGAVEAFEQETTRRMRAAADRREFERAALRKRQLDAARAWRERWSGRVGPDRAMNAMLLFPSVRRRAWKPFLFRRGVLEEGPLVAERRLPTVTPAWLTGALASEPPATDARVRMEQTWLAAHALERRDARSAVSIPLGEGFAPADLAERLESTARASRT